MLAISTGSAEIIPVERRNTYSGIPAATTRYVPVAYQIDPKQVKIVAVVSPIELY
jgi:hypothetical protein